MLAISVCAVARASAQEMPQEGAGDPCGPRAAPIPPPPAVPSTQAPPATYEPLRGLDSSFPLGVGHLSPAASALPSDADWFLRVQPWVWWFTRGC